MRNAASAVADSLVSPTSDTVATSAVAEVIVEAAEGVAVERPAKSAKPTQETPAEEPRVYEHPRLGTFKQYASSKDGKLLVFQDADGHIACVRAEKLVADPAASDSEE